MAAVAVSGLAVLTSGVVSLRVPLIASRRAAELARETRTQQRLAESNLDVLKIVEREGLRWRAQVHNWQAPADEHDDDPIPRMKVPGPELTDLATASALLAAFGSEEVRARYDAWRGTADGLRDADAILNWNMSEQGHPNASPSEDDLGRLHAGQSMEAHARQHLADAVARELGHRW